MTWDDYFINLCYEIAKKSKDPSTKVGAVIVYPDNGICSTGFNGFARGVIEDDLNRWEDRDIKYPLICHAESNAILNAARHGHATKGCRLYVPWHPCSACANAIVQAGIEVVVMDRNFVEDLQLMKRWEKEHNLAKIILGEGGVLVRKSFSE